MIKAVGETMWEAFSFLAVYLLSKDDLSFGVFFTVAYSD
jgi:hypothetical protein